MSVATNNNDIFIISGYRADYYYRYVYDAAGNIRWRRFLYCKPRKGFRLFKVVGHHRIVPDGNLYPAKRFVFAIGEQDAVSQCKATPYWVPSYACDITDTPERKEILSDTFRMP